MCLGGGDKKQALVYLQSQVAECVNHEKPDESQAFRSLASWLYKQPVHLQPHPVYLPFLPPAKQSAKRELFPWDTINDNLPIVSQESMMYTLTTDQLMIEYGAERDPVLASRLELFFALTHNPRR